METISLNIKSPKVSLPGLDDFIERMERADGLIERLEARRTVRIQFAVTGDERLKAAAMNMDALAEAFRSVGEVKVGDNIAAGLVKPGEAAKYAAAELEKLRLKFKELNETAVTASAKFQGQSAFSAGDLEKLAARRKGIEAIIGERNDVQARMEGLQKAGGMAAVMSDGVIGVTTAELALAPASRAASTALETQDAIVRQKIVAMQGLTAATEATTTAEKAQATAAAASAQANVKGALLSERVVKDLEGNEVNRIRQMRTGAGETLTTSAVGSVAASDRIKAHRAAFEQLDVDFSGKRADLAGAGFGAASPEQLALIRDEVAARRERLKAMEDEGLGAESLASRQRVLTAGMEKSVSVTEQSNKLREQTNVRKAAAEAEAAAQKNLTTSLRDQVSVIDRQYQSARAAAATELELAQATRTRAQQYRQAANDARAAQASAGLPSDPRRESYLRGMGTRSATMEADAQRVEASLRAANLDALREARANAAASQAHAREFLAFDGKNARTSVESMAGGERVVKRSATREGAGQEETLNWTQRYGAANEVLESKLTRTTNAVAAQASGLAKMVDHLKTAMTWMAAYALVGKSLELVGEGFGSAVKTERQFATLQQVFRGTNEEALALGNTSLKLATAEGRAGDEATDAAVRWSRLGLSQKEAAEAVDVSLQAANVAQVTAAEGAEYLAAAYASYGLQVGELRTLLNEVNVTSNTLNVTNKDLFQGIARTGNVAKQAGVPLAELIGLIGAGVSRTGRSGAEIGNALKATIVSIANPGIQKKLEGIFKFDVKTPLGELKDFSEVFSELYVKVQEMDDASRGELLQKLGGKQQASRLQAILDGYVTAEVKAIEAQKDLNATERESTLIRGTVASQLQSVTTEFQRLFYAMVTVGGDSSVLNNLKRILGGLTEVEGWMADHPGLGLIDVEETKRMKEWNAAHNGGGKGKGSNAADDIGVYNRDLERLKGQAGAAEMSERLADRLGRALPGLAARDPRLADRSLREFATVTSDNPEEAKATGEQLVRLRQEGRLNELVANFQERSVKFAEQKRDALLASTAETQAQLTVQEKVVGQLEKEIAIRKSQHLDSPNQQRKLMEAKKQIDDLNGIKGNLLGKYIDEDGFNPLDQVEKMLGTQLKNRTGGQNDLFNAGIGDTEMDKLDRKTQALDAQEEMLKRKEGEKDSLFKMFPKDAVDFRGDPIHSEQEIVAQEQMNTAIAVEVDAQRDAIALEREKIGILRETARIQDEMSKGIKEGRGQTVAGQVGTNETERDLSEVSGIGRLAAGVAQAGIDAKGQGELIAYANRLLEIQAGIGERRYRLERDIANAKLEQNREAGKALEMASREDQLRAALLEKFVQQSGGAIGKNQFQFLDQPTREAAQRFAPDAVPDGGKIGDMKAEQELLQKNFEGLNGTIDRLLEGMKRAVDPGALLRNNGGAAPPPPQVNLPPVNFNLGPEFERMTQSLYQVAATEVRNQIGEISARVDAFLGAQRASRAQGGGAGSINS